MDLTNEMIELGYKHARIYCWKRGRKNVDFRDIAHEAFVRIGRVKTPPAGCLENKIRWIIKSVYRDLYTNTTTRKKELMHEAWHTLSEWEPGVAHENTVDVSEDYKNALTQVYLTKKNYFELLVDFRTMEAIAKERHVSSQAINEQKKHARRMLKSFLDAA